MTNQEWLKYLKEAWAGLDVIDSRAVMAFSLALKYEDEGDLEKAEDYLGKAIQAEEKASA